MDYTLLTAVHLRTNAPAKMNARQEQEYYERSAARQALLETLLAAAKGIWRLASALFARVKITEKGAGHGMTAHNAIH